MLFPCLWVTQGHKKNTNIHDQGNVHDQINIHDPIPNQFFGEDHACLPACLDGWLAAWPAMVFVSWDAIDHRLKHVWLVRDYAKVDLVIVFL